MRQSDFLREKVHTMNVTDFNFELPQELIAQDPLEDRAASRLLVLNKETGNISHRHFRDIRQYLKKGDCLVINDTKVIPARLIGHKVGTDAKIEVVPQAIRFFYPKGLTYHTKNSQSGHKFAEITP